MGFSYLQNKSWLEITREERLYCAFLYWDIKDKEKDLKRVKRYPQITLITLISVVKKKFITMTEYEDEKIKKIWPEKNLELLIKNNKLYVFDSKQKKYLHIKKDGITIHPASGRLNFKKNIYQGALTLQVDTKNKKILFLKSPNLLRIIF